jgi:hypothetical protein
VIDTFAMPTDIENVCAGKVPAGAAPAYWFNVSKNLDPPSLKRRRIFPSPVSAKEDPASALGSHLRLALKYFSCSRNSSHKLDDQVEPGERPN